MATFPDHPLHRLHVRPLHGAPTDRPQRTAPRHPGLLPTKCHQCTEPPALSRPPTAIDSLPLPAGHPPSSLTLLHPLHLLISAD